MRSKAIRTFGAIGLLVAAALIFYINITASKSFSVDGLVLNEADPNNGSYVYLAAGCNSCHVSEEDPKKGYLAGGQKFETNFGTFVAPNISNSKLYGIGNWDFEDFYGAVKLGQNPEGNHYFPAFPFTSYSRMTDQDIADLWSFWQTLPSVDIPSGEHEISFPFNIRRNLGIWKTLYLQDSFMDEKNDRATYLVEALGHCAECHTPRDAIGGLKSSQWMHGAKNPSGKGTVPSIHPKDLGWSREEIVEYLSSGFTPNFDVVGGAMASVIENTSKLELSDRILISDYLLRLGDK